MFSFFPFRGGFLFFFPFSGPHLGGGGCFGRDLFVLEAPDPNGRVFLTEMGAPLITASDNQLRDSDSHSLSLSSSTDFLSDRFLSILQPFVDTFLVRIERKKEGIAKQTRPTSLHPYHAS